MTRTPVHMGLNARLVVWLVTLAGLVACSAGEGGGRQRLESRESAVYQKNSATHSATTSSATKEGIVKSGVTGALSTGPGGLDGDTGRSGSSPDRGGYRSKMIQFGQGPEGRPLSGFYTRAAKQTSPGPGLLLLHGAMGLSDSFRRNTEAFAAQGYRVFAPDLFAGTIPEIEADGQRLYKALSGLGRASVIGMISAAADHMLANFDVTMVGIIGWDEGGYWALATALTFKYQFRALINFYGSPFELINQGLDLGTPMMHIFVQKDPRISMTDVLDLEKKVNRSGVDPVVFYKFHGVVPGFLEPSFPDAAKYREDIERAYRLTFGFLAKHMVGDEGGVRP